MPQVILASSHPLSGHRIYASALTRARFGATGNPGKMVTINTRVGEQGLKAWSDPRSAGQTP